MVKGGTALLTYVFQAVPAVMKQQDPLAIAHIGMDFFDQVVGMAVSDYEVEVPVVIVVHEFQPPTAHQHGSVCNSSRPCYVVECLVVPALKEAVKLVVQVGHKQVHPPVLIDVGGINAHAGASPPPFAVSHSRGETDLL